jgi:hypothetical protein
MEPEDLGLAMLGRNQLMQLSGESLIGKPYHFVLWLQYRADILSGLGSWALCRA